MASPTAPRPMLPQKETHNSALDQSFLTATTNMYPKLALFQSILVLDFGFKDVYKRREKSTDEVGEARRDFLDSFAYLCDIKKGGKSVTATALQELPSGNILWLAANDGVRQHVRIYANQMLDLLKTVEPGNPSTREKIQNDILCLAIAKCSRRLEFYQRHMLTHAINCDVQLRHEQTDEIVTSLSMTIKRLLEPPLGASLVDLVGLCYTLRGPRVEEIRRRSRLPDDDFRKLAHFIGRLGATRSSVKTVVRAMITVQSLKQISAIRVVEAPEVRAVTISPEHVDPYDIVRNICMNTISMTREQTRSALRAIDDVDVDIAMKHTNKIRPLGSQDPIITRVHAECN